MNSFRDELSSELKRVDFASMSVAERYNFISGFVMNYYRQDIDAARKDIYYAAEPCRRAYYYSAEFLVGRLIYSNLYNLGILDDTKNVMAEYGCDIAQFEEIPDAALGNGGLGRLAACFLDSAATQNIRLCGCGIRYKYGLFKQDLSEGYQLELPDDWTRFGDPWSIRRDRDSVVVEFASDKVRAVPYDMPVFGYRRGEPNIDKSNIDTSNIDKSNIDTSMVGILRLWQSEALTPFNFTLFNDGKYAEAIAERERAERICAVLYPNDNTPEGKELRLRQQYFLTSAFAYSFTPARPFCTSSPSGPRISGSRSFISFPPLVKSVLIICPAGPKKQGTEPLYNHILRFHSAFFRKFAVSRAPAAPARGNCLKRRRSAVPPTGRTGGRRCQDGKGPPQSPDKSCIQTRSRAGGGSPAW